jgi:hypothetical protein
MKYLVAITIRLAPEGVTGQIVDVVLQRSFGQHESGCSERSTGYAV